MKLLSEEKPEVECALAEATLEDAYIYCGQFQSL